MMFEHHEKYIDVPMEERKYIYPEARKKLFINLVENYNIFCPTLEMLYAGLNFDAELKIDYLVIFRTQTKSGSIILWDAPYAYTNRCVPAYRFVVKHGWHEAFFKECMSHFCQMPEARFKEFLQSDHCNYLSLDSNSPDFWKNPNNIDRLMNGMSTIGLMYIPKGFKNPHRPNFKAIPADPRILSEYKKEG